MLGVWFAKEFFALRAPPKISGRVGATFRVARRKGRHRVRSLQRKAKLTLCCYNLRFLAKNSNARYTKSPRMVNIGV